MAVTTLITVKEVTIEERQTNTGMYRLVHLKGKDENTYTGLESKFPVIPMEGEQVSLWYKKVNINGKEQRTILQCNEVKVMTTGTRKTLSSRTSVSTGKSTELETFSVKGKLFYAKIKAPDTTGEFPTGKYILDLSVSDKTRSALEDKGVEIKTSPKNPEKGNFVRIRSIFQPTVIGEDGEVLTGENIPLMGNGTEATIDATLYPNKARQGGRNCLGMKRIHITSLVPYTKTTTEVTPLTDE